MYIKKNLKRIKQIFQTHQTQLSPQDKNHQPQEMNNIRRNERVRLLKRNVQSVQVQRTVCFTRKDDVQATKQNTCLSPPFTPSVYAG